MHAVTREPRNEFGASMGGYVLRQTLCATVGLVALLAGTHSRPHAALPRQILNLPSAVPASETESTASIEEGSAAPREGMGHEQRAVVEFIAGRYRIAHDAVAPVVLIAYGVGNESAVDPLLILAVIGIESSFNPAAESVLGAKGLMQVMAKFHMDKVALHGDPDMLLDPDANIRVGTQILREYLHRFGELETALQSYAGAANDPDSGYAHKVLAERSLIEQNVIRLRRAA